MIEKPGWLQRLRSLTDGIEVWYRQPGLRRVKVGGERRPFNRRIYGADGQPHIEIAQARWVEASFALFGAIFSLFAIGPTGAMIVHLVRLEDPLYVLWSFLSDPSFVPALHLPTEWSWIGRAALCMLMNARGVYVIGVGAIVVLGLAFVYVLSVSFLLQPFWRIAVHPRTIESLLVVPLTDYAIGYVHRDAVRVDLIHDLTTQLDVVRLARADGEDGWIARGRAPASEALAKLLAATARVPLNEETR
ncbi:MAG: hypothetical protein M3O80_03205 [Chloroflexota bacterium]|nr:hypothetical protein [Chloroflexota bacterium]